MFLMVFKTVILCDKTTIGLHDENIPLIQILSGASSFTEYSL